MLERLEIETDRGDVAREMLKEAQMEVRSLRAGKEQEAAATSFQTVSSPTRIINFDFTHVAHLFLFHKAQQEELNAIKTEMECLRVENSIMAEALEAAKLSEEVNLAMCLSHSPECGSDLRFPSDSVTFYSLCYRPFNRLSLKTRSQRRICKWSCWLLLRKWSP